MYVQCIQTHVRVHVGSLFTPNYSIKLILKQSVNLPLHDFTMVGFGSPRPVTRLEQEARPSFWFQSALSNQLTELLNCFYIRRDNSYTDSLQLQPCS